MILYGMVLFILYGWVLTNEKQFLHEGTELSAKVTTLFDPQFTEANVEAEVCFIIQLLHIIHYHEREFNKQFERPFWLALIVQRHNTTRNFFHCL